MVTLGSFGIFLLFLQCKGFELYRGAAFIKKVCPFGPNVEWWRTDRAQWPRVPGQFFKPPSPLICIAPYAYHTTSVPKAYHQSVRDGFWAESCAFISILSDAFGVFLLIFSRDIGFDELCMQKFIMFAVYLLQLQDQKALLWRIQDWCYWLFKSIWFDIYCEKLQPFFQLFAGSQVKIK